MLSWFDAHLDLAYLAGRGRRMLESLETCGGPHLPAGVTLASLREGNIRWALGTIFTEPDGTDAEGYPAADYEAAHEAGTRQLAWYESHFQAAYKEADGLTLELGMENPLRIGILIENADPIRDPGELAWWVAHGVMAVGMAWWKPSKYAGGNRTDMGLTAAGRDLLAAMDELSVIHDLSHLSQRATDELLARTDKPVMASHSNCRALLGGESDPEHERHLADETIAEIGRRGGVVGLNLYRSFLRRNLKNGERPGLEEAAAHVEHVCEIMGHRNGVGLGSDMDGGFGADQMCEGIERHADLGKLSAALARRGWSNDELAGFTHGNWLRFFRSARS